MNITDEQKQQFQEEGYFILENVIPEPLLELLRGECGTFIRQMDADMDRQDTDVLGINHRNKRYFVSNCFRKQPKLRRLWGNAEPLLKDGKSVVGEPPPDIASRFD